MKFTLKSQIIPLLAFLAPLGVLLFIFRGLIFLNQFFLSNDVILQLLPYLSYRTHGALISQNILSGFPLFVSTNVSWWYPVSTYLFAAFAPITAYSALTFGNMVLTYLFSYLYARQIHVSHPGAIMAATIFTFSGQVMLWASSTINTNYYFILPAVLLLFELGYTLRWPARLVLFSLLGALLGVGLLSAHVQYVVYIHTFYFVYVLAQTLLYSRVKEWRVALTALAVPYACSFVVGLPMVRAVLSFQPETLRASGVDLAQSVGGGYLPWDIVHLFLPFWNLSFFPSTNPNLYLGVLPLILLALFLPSLRKTRNAYAVWFAATLSFCLIASIRYSPLAYLLHALPFWNAFREPQRIMFVGEFAAAMLCGFTLDYLAWHWKQIDFYRSKTVQVILKVFLFFALPLILVITAVRLFFFDAILSRIDSYVLARVYPHTTGLPKEHYLAVASTYLYQLLDQFSFFDWQMVVFVASFAASVLLLRARALSAERFATLAVLLVCLNMAAAYGWYYEMVDAKQVTAVPHTVEAIRNLEKGNISPFRVYSVFPAETVYNDSVACSLSPEEKVVLQNELLQPNAPIYFSLDSVEGYENFMPARVSEQLGYIGSESTAVKNPLFLQKLPLAQKLDIIFGRSNALRAFNVKYVVSGMPLSYPTLTFKGSWQLGHCKTPVYLYQLAGAWPRYFLTNQTAVATSSDPAQVFDALNAHASPFVLFNEDAVLPASSSSPFFEEVIPRAGERDLTFDRVSCATDCTLLVGNTYLRGWSATVDGAPAPVRRANYVYMALTLTSGEHAIVFTYRQP